jgi:TIGR03009 family protein
MVTIARGLKWTAVYVGASCWLGAVVGLAQEPQPRGPNARQSRGELRQEQPRQEPPPQVQAPGQSESARPRAPQRTAERQQSAPAIPRTSRLRNLPGVPQPRRPREPWVLSPQQEAELDLVLRGWEEKSGAIKTLTCEFTMLEYDPFTDKAGRPVGEPRESRGEIKYAEPDKGVFHVTKQRKGDSIVAFEGEHWVCDGRALYEYDHKHKKLMERILPDELKGQAISNGPLPFLFGATAERMRQRYWLRLITPREDIGKKIWIEAVPKFQEDRANYERASIILNESDMLPSALQLKQPNEFRKVYVFGNFSINSLWKKVFRQFDPPRVPSDWEHEVEEPPPSPGQVGRRLVPPDELQPVRIPLRK